MEQESKLKNGIRIVFLSNVVTIVLNLLINFLQPRYLSVESYSLLKSFHLYISYIGILHLGYINGMYLDFGGKTISEIGREKLSINISTLRLFQLIISAAGSLFSLYFHNKLLLFVFISVFPYNLGTYYSCLYQATGDFFNYGSLIAAQTILTFLYNVVLFFIIRTDNAFQFIAAYIFSYVLIWLIPEAKFYRKNYFELKKFFSFSVKEFILNIKSGFLLLLGNFTSIILTSADRWFVKFFLDNTSFAYYSFAASIEGFLNVAISPITLTLYNYFCKNDTPASVKKIRNYVSIFAVLLPAAVFPVKIVLDLVLQKYEASFFVILCLFSSQEFFIIINAIYVNLYKARKQQSLFFKNIIISIIAGIFLNFLSYKIGPRMESFAIATLITSIFYFFLCGSNFNEIRYSITEIFHLLLSAFVLIISGYYLQPLWGLMFYLVTIGIFTFILYKEECSELMHSIETFFSKKLQS